MVYSWKTLGTPYVLTISQQTWLPLPGSLQPQRPCLGHFWQDPASWRCTEAQLSTALRRTRSFIHQSRESNQEAVRLSQSSHVCGTITPHKNASAVRARIGVLRHNPGAQGSAWRLAGTQYTSSNEWVDPSRDIYQFLMVRWEHSQGGGDRTRRWVKCKKGFGPLPSPLLWQPLKYCSLMGYFNGNQ